jgi:signal transduction histidine kinase
LLLEGDVPEDMKADLQSISSEGRRAAAIVKNLLTFARSHALSSDPSDINAVINEVLNLRAHEHKVRNIEVVTQLSQDIPAVLIDHFQLQQVFLNIVLNAEQAMADSQVNGKLTVTTEALGKIVKISFANDGPEIPPDIIHRIFDPFFTTKEVGKGTGLGLSICYGIITNLGGKIYAQNQTGKGPVFIIELPLKTL